jgi:hypothetical protein
MKADINSLLGDKLDGAVKVTSSRSKSVVLTGCPRPWTAESLETLRKWTKVTAREKLLEITSANT